MRRRILGVSALLVVLVACRDGPAELTAPVEAPMAPQPDVTMSADAVQTVVELLDDPFVRELMGGVRVHTELLYGAARDASIYGTEDHVVTLSRILAATMSELFASADDAEEDADEAILRAALALVLDDAVTLLERPLPGAEGEQRGRDEVHH